MKPIKAIIALIVVAIAVFAAYYYYAHQVDIENIEVSSPNNLPLNAAIQVKLNQAEAVYVEYWKEGDKQSYKTTVSNAAGK